MLRILINTIQFNLLPRYNMLTSIVGTTLQA